MKVLFTFRGELASFMSCDVSILQQTGTVCLFRFAPVHHWHDLTEFARQAWHLVRHRYDVYFCYFSDYHSLLPVLCAWITRRRSIVIVAGYDAMGYHNNHMHYGVFVSGRWRRWSARIIYRLASRVLIVSEDLAKDLSANGVILNGRISCVPFGYNQFHYTVGVKQKYVLTVGIARDVNNYFRKGYDRLLKLARMMPDVSFVAVGLDYPHEHLPNLTVIKRATHLETLRMMSRAKVYIQPSRAEGMCNATAEAMLSGCHVITSGCQGMTDLAGPKNIITNWTNLHPVADRIRSLMKLRGHSEINRNHIINNYHLTRRARAIRKEAGDDR